MNNEFAINQRLKEAIKFLKEQGYIRTTKDFIEKINSNKTVISLVMNDKRVVSDRLVNKICKRFPMLSEEWLLNGRGEMVIEGVNEGKKLPGITAERLIDLGSDVFAGKLLSLFKKGEIYPASVMKEKEQLIKELLMENGKLQATIEMLEQKLAEK